MKAYLVANPASLPPFGKPASEVRFREHTIGSRLASQLRDTGLTVVARATDAADPIEPGSLVVGDDVVASDSFFRRLVAAIPDRDRSYQVEIEAGRFPMLSRRDAPAVWRRLPIRYHGAAPAAGEPEPLRMQPTPVLSVVEGLPPRMEALTDICVYFFDYYAVKLDYWFELQIASSLYCRERVARLVGRFRQWLPHRLVDRLARSSWVASWLNSIGRGCRIHRTAILEGCTIGDGVEIGPFAYLRSSVIGDGAVVREKSSVKMSYLGPGAFIMGSDVVNCYVGAETSVFTPMLYNVVFGERGFLSGGSGFADFIVGAESIPATVGGKQVATGLPFLASAVGDDCFIGANMIFAPGRTIPDHTRLLDHGLIKAVPTAPGGTYVVSGTDLLQIPDGFLTRKRP